MISQKPSPIADSILQGNLIKLMLKLSVPSILGVLLLTLNTFIDAMFAGRFVGETALAGISLALPFTLIIQGLADFVGTGSASILSRAIGSQDIKIQSKIFGNLIIISVVISAVISAIGYGFSKELITLMGGSSTVAFEGTSYLKIYTLGTIFFIVGQACGDVISSEGKIRWTTTSMWIFITVNICLNYLFIVVYDGGTAELALATVMAMIVACIFNLFYFVCGKSLITVNLKKIAIAKDLLPEIFSVGIGSLLYPVMMLIQQFVVFNSISNYGTNNDIAFFGATEKIISLVFIPVMGLTQALQPVIGMNYGAKQNKRIKQAFTNFAIFALILLLLIWIPLQFSPKSFLNLILPGISFAKNDISNFRILSIFTPISTLTYFSITLFIALGKGKTILGLIILRIIILNVPFVLLFSRIFAVRGIYLGLLIADIIFVIIVFFLTFSEFINLNKLKSKNTNSELI
ncbi:MAG: MATE family efflux transporter [Cyanobacteria bacterium P01_A01_bin.40]